MVRNLVEAAPLSTAPVKRVLRSAAPLARLLRRALPWEARPAQAGLHPQVHAGSKLLTPSRERSRPCQPGTLVTAGGPRSGPAPARSTSSPPGPPPPPPPPPPSR